MDFQKRITTWLFSGKKQRKMSTEYFFPNPKAASKLLAVKSLILHFYLEELIFTYVEQNIFLICNLTFL